MSIINSINNFIVSVFNKAVALFREFLKVAIPKATELIMAQLKDFAINIIQELAGTDLTNEEKRNQAFLKIKDHAFSIGVKVKDNTIFMLIELVVSFLKEKGRI